MIEKPTVLVLGAGASAPYGFPVGTGLVESILELTSSEGDLTNVYDPHALRSLHARLLESDAVSIDEFLETNPNLVALGKACIAGALTVWGPLPSFRPAPALDWYKYLWHRIREGSRTPGDLRSNRLRIVTYNYDTSLERYIRRVLGATFSSVDEREISALAAAQILPIVHLHGTLGEYEEPIFESEDRTEFKRDGYLKRIATSIHIVRDDALPPEYTTAHRCLQEAESVHFLGFGYHPTNIRRLDAVTQSKHSAGWVSVGGTAFGLRDAERRRAEGLLQLGANILVDHDCLSYLRTSAQIV